MKPAILALILLGSMRAQTSAEPSATKALADHPQLGEVAGLPDNFSSNFGEIGRTPKTAGEVVDLTPQTTLGQNPQGADYTTGLKGGERNTASPPFNWSGL
jgi:hypothetical protein